MLKSNTPVTIPAPSGKMNFHWEKIFFTLREIKSINLLYIPNTTAIVPPDTPGITFATPEKDNNISIVTMFEAFPTNITVPLDGKGQEIAVLFVASTYCMHSYVENARITVTYADGTSTDKKLVYPANIDDWLTSALTTEGEIFHFNNYNHATVQKLRINPTKELKSIQVKAVANEVILGVAGISISR